MTTFNIPKIFYHGTTDVFQMDVLLPAIETGNLREEWRIKLTNKVFFTDSLKSAKYFSKKATEKYGGNPVIYVVKPIGEVWHVNTNEYVSDRAKIVCEV